MSELLDAADVKLTFDLLSLVQADTTLHRSGSGYYAPCPFCGGKDRFVLKDTPGGWRWYCRGCTDGKYKDSADYIMRRDNLSFRDALRSMAGSAPLAPRSERRAAPEPEPKPFPADKQDAWGEFCRHAAKLLFCGINLKTKAYLNARGLSDDTLAVWGIGYFPGGTWEGIQSDRCITIPCTMPDGSIPYVQRRMPVVKPTKENSKYMVLPGAVNALFGAGWVDGQENVFICEGEFDTILLNQEAGCLVGACTLGSATSRLDLARDARYLLSARRIMVSCDTDTSGKDANTYWRTLSDRVTVVNPPGGAHDITDAWKAGANLAEWVSSILVGKR